MIPPGIMRELRKQIFKRPYLDELIFGRVTRDCERCSRPTVYQRPRQRNRGFCAHHALVDEVELSDALLNLLAVFEGGELVMDEWDREVLVPTMRPVTGHWLVSGTPIWFLAPQYPREAGPCTRCRRPIRRYGPSAVTHCSDCFKIERQQ